MNKTIFGQRVIALFIFHINVVILLTAHNQNLHKHYKMDYGNNKCLEWKNTATSVIQTC